MISTPGPVKLRVEIERWQRRQTARIAGYSFDVMDVLVVNLEKDGVVGRGEARGVYYRGDDAATLAERVDALRPEIEAGITRSSLQRLLPSGGARNALDCACWDLEAKLSGVPAWLIAGLEEPRPLVTTLTCHAGDPEAMAANARRHRSAKAIKLKLTGESIDADRLRAVREALPGAWLSVDANQGFTRHALEQLMPVLMETAVALIEQPFPIGQEALLDGFRSPIPIAADESMQGLADIPQHAGRFDVVNIKLDKCGGLTEGLEMVRLAREMGLGTMVGNMGGTSLAMAPAFLLGQLCDVVDLDGPVFLKADRPVAAEFADGRINCPRDLWG